MNPIFAATALLLGSATAVAPLAEHQVRIDHPSGAVDARYRADVAISHRQTGSVMPGGRGSTLRCLWSVDVAVVRDARHASGALLSRAMRRDAALTGSRAGWCDAGRGAIAQEVARRHDAIRDHVMAVAREDHPTLRAELDRLHGETRAG